MSAEHPQTTDTDGRAVVFDAGSRLHLARRRPWLLDHVDTIMDTIARPDFHSLHGAQGAVLPASTSSLPDGYESP
jgi:hypothetical protein